MGELGRVVDAVCAHPDAVALIGVAGARSEAFASACVLAVETAVAAKAAAGANQADRPSVDADVVAAAVAAKEETLGRPLTDGQRKMVAGICTSGRGVEMVLGVAGAGKTTGLDVARTAFETAGYRVIGTSTSGQAARTLGRQTGISEARTMASLLWRLDNHRLALDARTIVILDEAGMADDPSVLCLLAAAETAGSIVVLVGDHLQLGAVGPGGTLESLIARYSHAVHVLDDNVRQEDPGERAALVELRAGNVKTAVDWYCQSNRVVTAPDRDGALDAMVAAWATDVGDGMEAVMMAWRRSNVAALNTRARQAMTDAGQLTGPELTVAGRVFQAGEWIVTLAPGAQGEVVTSERGTVTTVDTATRCLTARMDDGRTQTFGADDLSAEKVGYGHATTVHRCQGATTDAAHLFADGGGRELGYVAMSRARQTTHVHVVADDIEQAAEDLVRDWEYQRRQIWAIDTGTPTTRTADRDRREVHPLEVESDQATPAVLRAALARARLTAERHALATAVGVGILADPRPAQDHLVGLDRRIQGLNPAIVGVVRTPNPAGQPRPRPASVYPIHPAPSAPGRDTGPSL